MRARECAVRRQACMCLHACTLAYAHSQCLCVFVCMFMFMHLETGLSNAEMPHGRFGLTNTHTHTHTQTHTHTNARTQVCTNAKTLVYQYSRNARYTYTCSCAVRACARAYHFSPVDISHTVDRCSLHTSISSGHPSKPLTSSLACLHLLTGLFLPRHSSTPA